MKNWIELAEESGINRYLTGDRAYWCYGRNLAAFAEAIRAESKDEIEFLKGVCAEHAKDKIEMGRSIAELEAAIAASAQDAARLTDKQIEAGWHQTFSTSNPFCPCDLRAFKKAVNWAQSAIAQESATNLADQPSQDIRSRYEIISDLVAAKKEVFDLRAAQSAANAQDAARYRMIKTNNWMEEGLEARLDSDIAAAIKEPKP